MVFHKVLTPAAGCKGIKMTKRRLVLTKIVLEQVNTAAAVYIRNERDTTWFPLEFLDSEKKGTADLNLIIDKGEAVFFLCKQDAYFGARHTVGDRKVGGQVVVHMYGNMEEEQSACEPSAKRARTSMGADGAVSREDFH
eukprot:TRINITY_DN13618_c0_g1_i1.p2 TRINITY_DN13618_c0_g1~~TRINITY_DN13618_c0_g1_i1.p2  ORF type:complete len:139 (-),score=23.33 TRINITY_DN13618_c0_g1_i1:863-1279(-)